MQLTAGLLFAAGDSTAYEGTHSTESAGLTVYGLDVRKRCHAFGDATSWSAVF